MRNWLDFIPLLLFFVAYKIYDIYVGTLVAIIATFILGLYLWLKTKRLDGAQSINLLIIAVFGGATLYFQDEQFIKWKPTIINWLFALILLSYPVFKKGTLLEMLLGRHFTFAHSIWLKLNWGWVLFFAAAGAANLYVAFNYGTDTWVNFKVFGMVLATLTFIILQTLFMIKFSEPTDQRQ